MRPDAWDNSNTRGQPAAFVEAVVRAQRASIAEHGIDPCTRAQAAAHEAGHVVVGHAYGETVRGARLWAEGDRWVGANVRDHDVYRRPEPARMTDEPDRALRCAVLNLAGFAGEIAAGLEHPSSSIDERMKAQAYASIVAAVWGGSEQQVEAAVMALCLRAIQSNRLAFDAVRGHIFRTRRLTAPEAVRMLRSVRRIELPTCFLGLEEARRMKREQLLAA